MKPADVLRWALVPAASMAGCSGCILVADAIGGGATRIISPEAGSQIETLIPMDFRVGLIYAIAAAVWVFAGTYFAPRRSTAVVLLLFSAGASLAWFELSPWYFPELHPRAYQPSRVPLLLSLAGGLVAAAITMTTRRRTPTSDVAEAGSLASPTAIAPQANEEL